MKEQYKLKYLSLSLLMVALVACKPDAANTDKAASSTEPAKTAQAGESTTSTDDKKVLSAADVTFTAVPFAYELPENIKDKCIATDVAPEGQRPCPVIDVRLAQVNVLWIQNLLNKSITDDDGEDRLKFKRSLDDFALDGFDEEYVSAVPYEYKIEPQMLKAHKNVAQFSVLTSTYMGGAHGMYGMSYLLFDMDLNSQIKLADMYESVAAHGEFYKLAEAAFDDYIVKTEREWRENETRTDDEIIAEYKRMYEFELSDDVYFNEKGIVLSYSPYHLGSFAQGFIELEVPYDKLDGVIRKQYLPH